MQGIPWETLKTAAQKAQAHAYAPYSKLKVGAAVWTGLRVHTGCNVENASFGLTVCAERHALAQAIAQGESPQALLLVAQTPSPLLPCGACRQVLVELCAVDLPLLCVTLGGAQASFRLSALLPFAFGKRFLPPT
jgi:cytidine deaminase